MMILICFGTRPEWLKIKPVVKLLHKDSYQLLFTGQHPDLLNDIAVDYKININQSVNRLDQLVNDCILQFPNGEFDSVLVQGDTASAFGCALAAFHRKLKIYYLEAGLRSYDLKHPYPEEGYRQMIARLANVNFAPTQLSFNNLKNEQVNGPCYITGNTSLDNLINLQSQCEYGNKILVTLHRRENHYWMDEWFKNINDIAKNNADIEFILPIHPNPEVQKHKNILTNVKVTDPLDHETLLNILVKCKLVITDSGGIQEEATFLNKKTIVCRNTTERPEGIETGHLFLCETPNKLKSLFDTINKNYSINTSCPYGDGFAAEKIVKLII